ncbi:unnamed protein product, partial [Ascophyllum nodosum]
VGAPTGLAACVVPALFPGRDKSCPRLEWRERPPLGAFRLPLAWRPRRRPCWRHWRMRSFNVSNKDPSGSCLPNSSLMKEKAFLKGVRHRQRPCSVEPQLQQRPLR